MSETINQTRSRLENIRSVEPILGALRTIAMGNWKAALNRRSQALEYAERISRVMSQVLPLLPPHQAVPFIRDAEGQGARVRVLAVGSERGLCGAFNRVLVERTRQYLEDTTRRGEQVQLQVAGSRAARVMQRTGITPDQIHQFSATTLPAFALGAALARDWLIAYERGDVDRVDVLYNAYLSGGRYEPRLIHFLPPHSLLPTPGNATGACLEPIIETDPTMLFAASLSQQLATQLYACFLESSASENSARYQLLEDARLNTERLVEELEAETVQAYRQATTQEIQNLAVGAGLLSSDFKI